MDKILEYEKAPKEIIERLARLEEHRQHVATDKDMMRLEGKIDTSIEMLSNLFWGSGQSMSGDFSDTEIADEHTT